MLIFLKFSRHFIVMQHNANSQKQNLKQIK